jgi:hypothetical protein
MIPRAPGIRVQAFKLGVTGSRHGGYHKQFQQVELFLIENDPTLVRHGDCVGWDKWVHEYVQKYWERDDIDIHVHPPADEKMRAFCGKDESNVTIHPAKSYHVRDRDIVDGVDHMLVLPRSMTETLRSGTWTTWRYTVKIKKPWTMILPDGTIKKTGELRCTY